MSPRELRRFLGEPKQRQWKALLKRSGVTLNWGIHNRAGGRPRCGLNRNQVLRVLRTRYAELGERRINGWRL